MCCPYRSQFGKWDDHVLKRVGGVVKDGSAVSDGTRGKDGAACHMCGGPGHLELPLESNAKARKVKKLKKKKQQNVMMVCNGCHNPWHVACVPHNGKGKRSTVPLTGTWFCHKCAQPCETCDEKYGFDDATKRLLRCNRCDKSVHMHCLNTPLKQEPAGSWRCAECDNRRMVTRLMAAKTICAFCHEDVRQGKDCQECSLCSKMWHTKRPCLKGRQKPKKGEGGEPWRCPECAD